MPSAQIIQFPRDYRCNDSLGRLPQNLYGGELIDLSAFDSVRHQRKAAADLDMLCRQSAQVLNNSFDLLLKVLSVQCFWANHGMTPFVAPDDAGEEGSCQSTRDSENAVCSPPD